MRKIQLLPNLVTLGNAFCGVLAISTAIDALVYGAADELVFFAKMERACMLIFLGMFFDTLDGFVARLTRGTSAFGAQLDSFADALTFGLAPAVLVKVLLEHAGGPSGTPADPRLHFLAIAAFSLLAILRLVRFNLETESEQVEDHRWFRGLPSPAAAGAAVSSIWLYLVLRQPELEVTAGTPTPFHRLMGWMDAMDWAPILDESLPFFLALMPVLGLLMVSNVRYRHLGQLVTSGGGSFVSLVWFLGVVFLMYLAPVPVLFLGFHGFVWFGLLRHGLSRVRAARGQAADVRQAA